MKSNNRAFDAVAGYRSFFDARLDLGPSHQWARFLSVTHNFFRVLGVNPGLGRGFLPEEDRPGGPLTMLITDSLWRRAFGADPAIVGKQVLSEVGSYTVVGVLPSSFEFVERVDGFVTMQPGNSIIDQGTNTEVIGRLKPGFALRQAEADLGVLFQGYRSAQLGGAGESGSA